MLPLLSWTPTSIYLSKWVEPLYHLIFSKQPTTTTLWNSSWWWTAEGWIKKFWYFILYLCFPFVFFYQLNSKLPIREFIAFPSTCRKWAGILRRWQRASLLCSYKHVNWFRVGPTSFQNPIWKINLVLFELEGGPNSWRDQSWVFGV